MKIAVCIKRVPEMDVRFKIAPSGTGVDETGLKWDMSDFDGYAVEAALQITEKLGTGEVARAVHLKADPVPFDNFAIAKALAGELQGGGYDLILFGKMSIDSSNGAVGPIAAELLNLPCVSAASKLDVAAGKGTARRELEGAAELLEFSLPAVVTIDEGVARPRYPSLKGIMAAKKKPLDVKPAQLGDVRMTISTMALPPERPAGRILGEGVAAVPELVRLLQTEAKVL